MDGVDCLEDLQKKNLELRKTLRLLQKTGQNLKTSVELQKKAKNDLVKVYEKVHELQKYNSDLKKALQEKVLELEMAKKVGSDQAHSIRGLEISHQKTSDELRMKTIELEFANQRSQRLLGQISNLAKTQQETLFKMAFVTEQQLNSGKFCQELDTKLAKAEADLKEANQSVKELQLKVRQVGLS